MPLELDTALSLVGCAAVVLAGVATIVRLFSRVESKVEEHDERLDDHDEQLESLQKQPPIVPLKKDA